MLRDQPGNHARPGQRAGAKGAPSQRVRRRGPRCAEEGGRRSRDHCRNFPKLYWWVWVELIMGKKNSEKLFF